MKIFMKPIFHPYQLILCTLAINLIIVQNGNGQDGIINFKPEIDEFAKFPGGDKKLIIYLDNNLKYPDLAKKEKIEGKVFVTFKVNNEGEISEVKVVKGIGGGCNEEAIRLVKSMPNWIPANYKDESVDSQAIIAVVFDLQKFSDH